MSAMYSSSLDVLVTPESCFDGVVDFAYRHQLLDVGGVRMAWYEAGDTAGPCVVLLHGEPTWGYLYHDMMAPLAAAGARVLVPDLIGFGRSDKPARIDDHSYAAHVGWVSRWISELGLTNIVLFGQDWGALIGLRILAAETARFERVFIGNGFLPTGDGPTPLLFRLWRGFARSSPVFPIGAILQAGTRGWLSRAERGAFTAPFPDRRYMAGPRALPRLVPMRADDPASQANRDTWASLDRCNVPIHTCFADFDPVTRGLDRPFRRIAGGRNAAHTTIRRAGHFLQLDAGAAIARFMLDSMASVADGRDDPIHSSGS